MPIGHYQASAEVIASPKFVVTKRVKFGFLGFGAFVLLLAMFFSMPKTGLPPTAGSPRINATSQPEGKTATEVPIAVGRDAWKAIEEFRGLGYIVSPNDLQREYIYGDDAALKAALSGQYVCYQDKVPGTSIEADKQILFTIGADCKDKVDLMVSGKFASASSVWSPSQTGLASALDNPTLEGWVVGYGDEYQPEQVTLLTLYGEVSVDLAHIEPLDSWCNSDKSDDDALIAAAMESRDEWLPLEAPVRVMFAAGPQDNQGFLHRLTADGQMMYGEAPANSVNEQLVRDGTWLPDDFNVEESSKKVAPAKRVWKLSSYASDLQPLELEYLKLLLAAANAQKTAPKNAMVECLAAAQSYWIKVELPYIKSSTSVSVDGGSSGGGGGGGRCWVNPYLRSGHWVRGYYRNC